MRQRTITKVFPAIMKKLMRCKKCGYNYLVNVSDTGEAEKKDGQEPEVQRCPACNAPV